MDSREEDLWSDKGLGREELDQGGLTPGKSPIGALGSAESGSAGGKLVRCRQAAECAGSIAADGLLANPAGSSHPMSSTNPWGMRLQEWGIEGRAGQPGLMSPLEFSWWWAKASYCSPWTQDILTPFPPTGHVQPEEAVGLHGAWLPHEHRFPGPRKH